MRNVTKMLPNRRAHDFEVYALLWVSSNSEALIRRGTSRSLRNSKTKHRASSSLDRLSRSTSSSGPKSRWPLGACDRRCC